MKLYEQYLTEAKDKGYRIVNATDWYMTHDKSDVAKWDKIEPQVKNLWKMSVLSDSKFSKKFRQPQKITTTNFDSAIERAHVFVAIMNDGLVAGMIMLGDDWDWIEKKQYGNIYDFIVLPKFRSKGIGSDLMESAVKKAKDRGFKTVRLNVWEKNVEAKKFYSKHKFATSTHKMIRKI